jgi:hypothetical protein
MSAEGDKEKGEVRFTPSPKAWAYLTWLSRNTVLGKSPHAVAEHILMQRLSEMRQDDYKQPDKD